MTKAAKNSKKGTPKVRSNVQPIDRTDRIDPRKKLLVRVAGSIAAAIARDPSPALTSSEKIADVAVDIAEQILCKAGVVPTATPPTDAPGQTPA